MTQGEFIIRPEFSKTPEVKEVKQLFTDLFDKIAGKIEYKSFNDLDAEKAAGEKNRCIHEALKNLEVSAMYAVKALTV